MEMLFPELPPPGTRPVEITATAPGREFPLMNVVTTEDDAVRNFRIVFGHAVQVPGYEITVRPFGG